MAEKIEGATTATMKTDRLTDGFGLVHGGRRPFDHGQGVEITLIGSGSYLLVAIEVGDAFVHGAPEELPLAAAQAPAPNLEFARLIDDGLDPQDYAKLVVHLQPIVFDAVLD